MSPRKRTIWTLASFCCVFFAYFLYAGIAVPLVIPDYEFKTTTHAAGPGHEISTPGATVALMEQVFPEGSWERGTITLLPIDENVLLLYEHQHREDNKLIVEPCTLIFLPNDPELKNIEQRYRHAVIMQANERAELRFSQSIANIMALKPETFEDGEMIGNVTISRKETAPGAGDDLLVYTSNIRFNRTQIKTGYKIDFRYGKSTGSGENLNIVFNPSEPGLSHKGLSLKSIELGKLEFLNFILPEKKDKNAETAILVLDENGNEIPGSGQMHFGESESRVRVLCSGKIDFLPHTRKEGHWIARFLRNVDLSRTSPEGDIDQLQCREMHIEFANIPNENEAAETTVAKKSSDSDALGEFSKLKPIMVAAYGVPKDIDQRTGEIRKKAEPVKIISPKNSGFEAECRVLFYDFLNERLILSDRSSSDPKDYMPDSIKLEVLGGDRKYTLMGKDLVYDLGKGDDFGLLKMAGNGYLSGRDANSNAPIMDARWNESLEIANDEDDPKQIRIQLRRGITVRMEGLGEMISHEADIWCDRTAKDAKSSPGNAGGGVFASGGGFVPQRARIYDGVVFEAAEGTCNTTELQLYFTQKSELLNENPAGNPLQANHSQSQPKIASGSPQGALQQQPPKKNKTLLGTDRKDGNSKYKIDSDVMLASVIMGGEKDMELDIIKFEGTENPVRINEVALSGNIQDPLDIIGKEVLLKKPTTDNAEIHIFGNEAEFQGHGVRFFGTNINIFRETNMLTSDGPGRLYFKVPGDAELTIISDAGKTAKDKRRPVSPKDEEVYIEWKGGMAFDGQQLLFEKNVRARYQQAQEITCGVLSLLLKNKMSFFESNEMKAEPETIKASKDVCIENHRFDGALQMEYNRADNLDEIAINVESGDFYAGKGVMKSTFRSEKKIAIPGSAAAQNSNKELYFMELRFHNGLQGNFKLRQGVAQGDIRCILKPVSTFNEKVDTMNDRAVLSDGSILKCNRMEISETVVPGDTKTGLELTTSGSTQIFGDIYTVRSDKAKFNQLKDLVIIEGDGRTDAELHRQEYPGAPTDTWTAQRIEYNLKTKQVTSSGTRSGDFRFGD